MTSAPGQGANAEPARPAPHGPTEQAGLRRPEELRAGEGLRYGALGAPLAFAALPLYVHLPNHYASTLGAPLAGLGAVLLATRAWDAFTDPWLGRQADGLLQRPRATTWRWAALGAMLLLAGLGTLYFPPLEWLGSSTPALLAWCAAGLIVTSLGYSGLGVLHQAWGTRLGGSPAAQARVVAWREGLALLGVLMASLLPAVAGVQALVMGAGVLMVLALWGLSQAPYPGAARAPAHDAGKQTAQALRAGKMAPPRSSAQAVDGTAPDGPWQQPGFRRLLAVFMLNGVASAVPATLVLFFVRDRLQAPDLAPLFLGLYFAAAGLAVPLWVRAVARFGLVPAWGAGMVLAVASFAWAAALGAGDGWAFALVCAASGAALGADLVAPGALLSGVVQRAGHSQRWEGRYVGWWTCATKLNLALAAGLALPLLQAMGYQPGATHPSALQALTTAYAWLPCGMKLAAAALLWHHRNTWTSAETAP